ncbi:TldD/PmbA family protein [Hyalangium sp.]|uniref:TldD/PmbA family protein n=1 Tax=Hyalangium sp. TaxID=2028555 RepID=UPI002D4EAAE7|nr:TldD/PmbA family protein [Hyalangium sp.]HYH96323.1 TldD/PmbA family protein [Hyalangium sp.]
MRLPLSPVLPLLAVSAFLSAAAPPADPRQELLDAMVAELTRNHQQLQLKGHEPPYFMSYQLKDYDQYVIGARYGALFTDGTSHDRRLSVDVRVGSYEFDSSVPEELDFLVSTKGTSYFARPDGPIDDSPVALRTALWLLTDERYKSALAQFLKKKGENVYTVEDPKRPPSFSKEKPNAYAQPPVAYPFDRERWRKVARTLSARFNRHPELFDSDVRITADKVMRLFVSTEGSRIVTEETLYGLHITAVTRAEDGQLLDDSRNYYSPTEAGLPDEKTLLEATDKVIAELLELRKAPAIDPYTGPAILAPEASGVLFHEVLGHRLEGHRQDDDREGKTFRGQEGKQILPAFLSIHDDPTVRELNGERLNGYYLYDEEGVKAQRVALVEKGVLRNYLLSRQPVEGFLQSNGHGRSQGPQRPVARMANLLVESSKQVSDEELKKQLIAEAKRQGKPYGLIIRDITGGNTNTSTYGYQAFKGVPRMVYRVDVRDGKETLVRGVEIVGTPLSAVNRVLASGRRQGVFNGFCGAESGMVPVSTVAPAMLLQEIELQRTMEGKDRPPILTSPAAASQPDAKR